MILEIKENCLVRDYKTGEKYHSIRTYKYHSDKNIPERAISDFCENFNSSNIIQNSYMDKFTGECLDSELLSITVVTERERFYDIKHKKGGFI